MESLIENGFDQLVPPSVDVTAMILLVAVLYTVTMWDGLVGSVIVSGAKPATGTLFTESNSDCLLSSLMVGVGRTANGGTAIAAWVVGACGVLSAGDAGTSRDSSVSTLSRRRRAAA